MNRVIVSYQKLYYYGIVMLTSKAMNANGLITRAAHNAYAMVQAATQIIGSAPVTGDEEGSVWVFRTQQSMDLAARIFGASNEEKTYVWGENDDPEEEPPVIGDKYSIIKGVKRFYFSCLRN